MTLEQVLASYNITHIEHFVVLLLLTFARWLMLTMTLPLFGAMILPSMIRIALALVMSCISVLVITPKTMALDASFLLMAALLIKELLLGFILGFFASLIFYIYELVGQFIDLARGASMAKMLVPELKIQSSPLGTLLFQFALVIFLALGLHRQVISAIFMSFTHFPPYSLSIPETNSWLYGAVGVLSMLFNVALRLSLPVIFLCFIIDIAFGLMNRVAPHINAYFLSLPAKIIGGLIMLFCALPFLADDFLLHYQESGGIERIIKQ